MNISGILVQTKPEHIDNLLNQIINADYCEYHLHDKKGRIIVTIEGDSTEDELHRLNKLKKLDFVIAADMMFSYSENELIELRKDLEESPPVIDWLNNPDVKAEQIRYNGDLKKKY